MLSEGQAGLESEAQMHHARAWHILETHPYKLEDAIDAVWDAANIVIRQRDADAMTDAGGTLTDAVKRLRDLVEEL